MNRWRDQSATTTTTGGVFLPTSTSFFSLSLSSLSLILKKTADSGHTRRPQKSQTHPQPRLREEFCLFYENPICNTEIFRFVAFFFLFIFCFFFSISVFSLCFSLPSQL